MHETFQMRLEFWVYTMILSAPSLRLVMSSYRIRQAVDYLYNPCELPHAVQELDPPSIEFSRSDEVCSSTNPLFPCIPFLDSTKTRARGEFSNLGVLDLDLIGCAILFGMSSVRLNCLFYPSISSLVRRCHGWPQGETKLFI